MKDSELPARRFLVALYDIAGDHPARMTPFGDVAQQATLSDAEAHAAFATLKQDGLIKSNRAGCVAMTAAGRESLGKRTSPPQKV